MLEFNYYKKASIAECFSHQWIDKNDILIDRYGNKRRLRDYFEFSTGTPSLEDKVNVMAKIFFLQSRHKTIINTFKNLIKKTDNMTPANTKSLLAFIFTQMEKLSNKEITTNEATAQAKLASQACNVLNYELKRSVVQMQLERMGKDVDATLRPVESLEYNNTTIACDETGLKVKTK